MDELHPIQSHILELVYQTPSTRTMNQVNRKNELDEPISLNFENGLSFQTTNLNYTIYHFPKIKLQGNRETHINTKITLKFLRPKIIPLTPFMQNYTPHVKSKTVISKNPIELKKP